MNQRGLDTTLPSVLVVVMWFLGMLACPFPWGRCEVAGQASCFRQIKFSQSIHTTNSLNAFLSGLCRIPGYIGPRHYSFSVIYQIIASPIMLALALRLDSAGILPAPALWAMLGCGNVVLLAGMALMACYMVPKYRETFFKVQELFRDGANRSAPIITCSSVTLVQPHPHRRTDRSSATWTSGCGRNAHSGTKARAKTSRARTCWGMRCGRGRRTRRSGPG